MASLFAQVVGWSQTVAQGDYPQHYFSVNARTADNKDLFLGAGVRHPSNIRLNLSLVRGLPGEPPKRGVGILAYHHAEKPAHGDIDGMDEFIVGWFWLPDALYDEIWGQVRENRYDACALELEFATVESAGPYARWDTSKNKIVPIMRACVRFERKLKPPIDPDASLSEPPKKRGLFSWAG